MPPVVRAGVACALLPAAIVILNGGWAGLVLAFAAGAGAGLLATSRESWDTRVGAARLGLVAGAAAGATLLAAQLVRDLVVVPLAGYPMSALAASLAAGTAALAASTAAGTVFGAIQALPAARRNASALGLLAVYAVLYPLLDGATGLGWLGQMIAVLIFVLLALGLNIVVGYAGLLDLGYAAFFAIGAYTTAMLSSPHLGIQLNFWVVVWLAAAVAAIWGVLLGAPTLPLRGDYLAIVTLGFGEIVPIVFRNLTGVIIREPFTGICLAGCPSPLNVTGGVQGINPVGRPSLPVIDLAVESPLDGATFPRFVLLAVLVLLGLVLFGSAARYSRIAAPVRESGAWLPWIPAAIGLAAYLLILLYAFFFLGVGEFRPGQYLPWYYLILALIAFSVFFINRLRGSRLGRAWTAIREDELAASVMGIDLVRTKLLAFSMGATFSGFAGAFYAAYIAAVFPQTFDFSISVIILCMVILGGMGNMAGVILGALIIMGADRIFLPMLGQLAQAIFTTSVFPWITSAGLREFMTILVDPSQLRLLLFGLTLVVMMLVRPEGLLPSARRRLELHENEDTDGAPDALRDGALAPSEAESPRPAIAVD